MTLMRFLFFVCAASIIVGCSRPNEETDHGAPGGGSVTLWTSRSELFMEYPAIITGEEVRFAVHLTWLSDFLPVTEGNLTLEFVSADGVKTRGSSERPSSPGIFRPAINFDQPGTYHLILVIDGRSTDTIRIEGFRVFRSVKDIPPEDPPPQGEQLITFLKEQQWKTEFRTEPVGRGLISGTLRAACEIVPRLYGEAVVAAPFTGTIPLEENSHLPTIGQYVRRGDALAVMVPSAETPSGVENFASRYIEAQSERELAGKEFDRAKRLHGSGLISDQDYEEVESEFKRAEATYHTLSKYAQAGRDGTSFHSFTLRSPLSGMISESHVVPGEHIDAGEPLYRILDTRSVWIRADVTSTDIGRLTRPRRAWLHLAGRDDVLEVNERNAKLISVAGAIDEMTRTFPVIFEVRNAEGSLRVGMFGEISIAVGRERESLVVPESALLEDEGRYSVYVQVEGEGFAKRDVTPGERNGELVEVLNGVSGGERVVTVGAYQVRLASLSSQLPAHGHAH